MSAAQALKEARAAGVRLGIEGDDLVLEASAPPPAAVLDLLSRHKADVLRMLRPAELRSQDASKSFADPNRFLVEIPHGFAVARWSRDADVATIARCILGTLKYEPHAVDTTVLRRALEGVIEDTARGGTLQKQEKTTPNA
jgi:hypothetical protein